MTMLPGNRRDLLLGFRTASALLGVALLLPPAAACRPARAAEVEPSGIPFDNHHASSRPVPPRAPGVTGISLDQSRVAGGNDVFATITLSSPAGPSGLWVPFLSSDDDVAGVEGNIVMVSPGRSAVGFWIETSPVTQSTVVTFSSGDQAASLTVRPPVPVSLTFDPPIVAGGSPSTGMVTLDAAPIAPLVLALIPEGAGTNPTGIRFFPPLLHVPAGSTSAQFPVTTRAVAFSNVVQIAAFLADPDFVAEEGDSATGSLEIRVPLQAPLASLRLSAPTVRAGQRIDLVITLARTTLTALPVRLTSSATMDPLPSPSVTSSTVLPVPPSVTVPAGQRSVRVKLIAGQVTGNTTVTVTGLAGGVTKAATVTVQRPVTGPPPGRS